MQLAIMKVSILASSHNRSDSYNWSHPNRGSIGKRNRTRPRTYRRSFCSVGVSIKPHQPFTCQREQKLPFWCVEWRHINERVTSRWGEINWWKMQHDYIQRSCVHLINDNNSSTSINKLQLWTELFLMRERHVEIDVSESNLCDLSREAIEDENLQTIIRASLSLN